MRPLVTLAAALILGSGSAACVRAQDAGAPARIPSISLPADLDRVLRDYERAWGARDAATLSSLFTEDGFVLSMGRPPVRGRAAIQQAYTGMGGPLTLAALAYATSDSVGYIIGTFGGTDPSTHSGKFVLTLRRSGRGPWLIASDMDNSSRR
jgi:ketosteroid isomerase-like protein